MIQLDNYGPWTLTLGSKREPDLQILQSKIYADLQHLFSLKGGLVFYTRFDNMLAVTSNLSIADHKAIQEEICKKYPVTVSMGIGVGATPFEAQENATKNLQIRGSSQLEDRCKILAAPNETSSAEDFVQIAHIDVSNVTQHLTDKVSAYSAMLTMLKAHVELANQFLIKNALVLFMGGDNFLALSNGMTKQDYADILNYAAKQVNLKFNAGVGKASNATDAMKLANDALNMVRCGEIKGSVHILS